MTLKPALRAHWFVPVAALMLAWEARLWRRLGAIIKRFIRR